MASKWARRCVCGEVGEHGRRRSIVEEHTRKIAQGDQVRVQAVGDEGELYADRDRTWLLLLVLDVPCVLYLLWWFKNRRWRGPRAAQLRPAS
jgi:hypothetical protein